jgi:hypothetical protein
MKVLRLCTVSDAVECYRQGRPLYYYSQQTYDGYDSEDQVPHREADSIPDCHFVFDGNLKREVHNNADQTKDTVIVQDWLGTHDEGPYHEVADHNPSSAPLHNTTYYYLTGVHSEYGSWDMQICQDPLNILSENAIDECHVWV